MDKFVHTFKSGNRLTLDPSEWQVTAPNDAARSYADGLPLPGKPTIVSLIEHYDRPLSPEDKAEYEANRAIIRQGELATCAGQKCICGTYPAMHQQFV